MNEMEKAFQYVDNHFDAMVDDLKDLCSHRSVAGDGEGLEQTRQSLVKKLRQIGLNPVLNTVEGGNAVLSAHADGRTKHTVLFFNHYDVVEEGNRDLWKNDPFTASVRDGSLYARGVSDNKGGLMCRIHAVEAILAATGKLPTGVKFLTEGDEETSSPSLVRFASEHPEKFAELTRADVALAENGRNDASGQMQAMFGMRGTCGFDLYVTTAKEDVHSRMGAIIPNAAWRLVWALAALKSPDEIVQIPGYYDGIPPMTQSDRDALAAIPYDEKGQKESLGIRSFVGGASDEELKRRYYYEPSFCLCGLESGEMYNGVRGIVPHTAHAHVSVYLVGGQDPENIQRALRNYLDKKGFSDIEIVRETPVYRAVRTPVDVPVRINFEWAAAQVSDKPLFIMPTHTGAGPAEILRRGCPDIPIIGIGPANTNPNHHAPNENLRLSDYKRAIKMIIALLYSFER